MNFKSCFTIVILLCFFSCKNTERKISRWHLVYKNSYEGKTLFGDKKALIDAVRMGHPLRIGFGGSRIGDTTLSMEHIVSAQFISITNGEDVFAQIAPTIGQTPDMEGDPVTIDFKNENQFSWIVGTNGTMSSLSFDFKVDSLREPSSSRRGFYWFVNAPIHQKEYEKILEKYPEPLWKNPRKRN